jgi:hypothetical protein
VVLRLDPVATLLASVSICAKKQFRIKSNYIKYQAKRDKNTNLIPTAGLRASATRERLC